MRTMIAVPCMDTIQTQFASCLMELHKPPETTVRFRANSLVYDSRNMMGLEAMDGKYDRVLWLDSDMVFPPDTLERLNEDMDEHGYDMVTGLYFRRHMPTLPVVYSRIDKPEEVDGKVVKTVTEYTDYPAGTIFPVDGCGFGCVLVTTDLLRHVWDRFGPAFWPYAWGGEDISFCYRAKLIGASMVCDSRIPVGHIGQVTYTEELYRVTRR